MKVRYMPEAGFGQAPAFVEYEGDAPADQAPLYQRQGYLKLNLDCQDVEVHERWKAAPGKSEEPDGYALPQRSIWATGVIGQARWGRFSLSYFGHSETYEELAVSIHRSQDEVRTYLAGNPIRDDLDIDLMNNPGFFLEVHLEAERYDALEVALVKPGARLRLSVDAGLFRDFYATWSPSISEGRIIKFLDTVDDVENAAEMPKSMLERFDNLEEDIGPPVEISVVWPAGERATPLAGLGQHADDEDSELEVGARHAGKVPGLAQASAGQSKGLGRIVALLMWGTLLVWGAVTLAGRL